MTTTADFSAFLRQGNATRPVLELAIDGVRSPSAIHDIESALRDIPGLVHARLNLTTRRLSTEWLTTECDLAPLIATLEQLGYRVAPFAADGAEALEEERTKWLLRCLTVAGFAAINVMLLSVSVWSGNITGMTPETRDLFHWLSALIALPAAGFAGQPFFLSAISALRNSEMNMDVPISVGVLLALSMSVYETAHHAEHAYFDSALMLLFFLLAGRVLDHAMRKRTRAVAANLAALRAPVATRIESDGTVIEIPSEALRAGDTVLVRPGERVSADGIVVSGSSEIDESLVTGETLRRAATVQTPLYAGTLNGSGSLTMTVTSAGANTLLSEIERLIEAAITAKSRYVQIADQIARIYAPVVHVAAALTAMGWILLGTSVHDALIIAIAVLIITCPCALALAAPTVQVVVAGALFRRGILMRAGDVIERMAAVDTIVFDKTGTLTRPEPSLIESTKMSPALLAIAGRLAASSYHPLARAIGSHVRTAIGPSVPFPDAEEDTGQGVRAVVDGVDARLGHPSYCGVPVPPWQGNQSLIAVRHGTESALFTVGQSLRPDAVQTIAALRKAGYRLMILSGDQTEAVASIAAELCISDWMAGVKPAEKLTRLDALKAEGCQVLMVGDGLNDAPALAAASVSLSPASGADVTQAAADAIFTGDSLKPVLQTLLLCKKGQKVMLENFGIALIYNLIAIPLAIAGLVTPLIAAAAMSGSSVLVTVNALRAKRVQEGRL